MYEDGRYYFAGVNFIRCLERDTYIRSQTTPFATKSVCRHIARQTPGSEKFCCTEYHTVTAIKGHVLLLAEQTFLSLVVRINELANIRTSSWGFAVTYREFVLFEFYSAFPVRCCCTESPLVCPVIEAVSLIFN